MSKHWLKVRLGPYLLTFLITLSMMMLAVPPVRASNCGTVAFFYGAGQNTETYSKYGAYTTQSTYDQTICGSSLSTGSAVLVFTAVVWSNGDFVALGYYKGIAFQGGPWTGSALHYYYDLRLNGAYTYSDISQGSGYVPHPGDTINYRLQGSLNTGQHYWYVTITKPGFQFTVSYITGDGDYAQGSTAELESHNNVNTASGHLQTLENLKQASSHGWTWTNWVGSMAVRSPNSPYCPTKIYDTVWHISGPASC